MTPKAESAQERPIRVLVGDDSYLLRAGIVHSLEETTDVEVVGAEGDLPSLREAVERTQPDVVVTDIRMPPTGTDEGVMLASELATSHPDVGVVVLSQYALLASASLIFEAGNPRRAYVLKDRVADTGFLLSTVKAVARGQPYLDPRIISMFVGPQHAAERQLLELTPRELEVLALLSEGASNSAIARELSITRRAVERHINTIFGKLGLHEHEDRNRRVLAALIYVRSRDEAHDA